VDLVVRQGVRPERRDENEAPGLSNEVWNLAEGCWVKDPLRRPNSSALADTLSNLISAAVPNVAARGVEVKPM
jgi:hypothetical protein